MIRLPRATSAALAAGLALSLTTLAPAAAFTPRPGAVQAAVDSAARYAGTHRLQTGVAVLDTSTGRWWTAGTPARLYPSASVVKTLIAARLLLDGRMRGATATRAWSMITRSDNAAAWALYPSVGRDHLLPWMERHYRIEIGTAPTMHGVWGSTQITARGIVRFYNAIRHDPAVWPWLGRAMHAYRLRSASGEPNAFGIPAAAPKAAIKNGWDTDRDAAHPRNAIVNTTGLVAGDRYAVAILGEGPNQLYYRGGEAILTAAAHRLVPALFPARTTSPSPITIVLDPGHNGGNASHLAAINRRVYAGYGRYKPCNTTGTATNGGYPEHAFTWDVAKRVRYQLGLHHIRVIMTRSSDTGVGPCVNRRAAIESTRGVAAAIAIHADGAASGNHGFHLCVDSRRPEHATRATVARTAKLNTALHRTLATRSGLSVSNYVGRNGYYYRDDLAGLNLSTSPTAFLELGNMRNAHDASVQRTAAGRARIARAITAGILAYLAALGR